ncbi:MAG: DUF2752 domain-containing protein [Candidatus Eiseniibacteriota bacterium]
MNLTIGGAHSFAHGALQRAATPRFAWRGWGIAGAAIAACAAALRDGVISTAEPVCWLSRVAHVSCPTCGLTRALTLLLRGEFASSLAMHPWGVALAAQVMAGWLMWGAWLSGRLRERPDRWIPRAVALNAAALLALWAVRLVSGTLP